jgi:hypothetical protein
MRTRHIVILLGIQFLACMNLAVAQGIPELTPTPQPNTPAPQTTPTPEPGIIQRVLYQLSFPSETISEALSIVLNQAARKEAENFNRLVGAWAAGLGEVIEAPDQGFYESFSRSGIPVAAVLAPALFLLRLALYHWERLVGGNDSALSVIGDWVAAGTLAMVAGPFLDLLARLGWWMAGAMLGETGSLAREFFDTISVMDVFGLVQGSLFSGLIGLGLILGGVLAVAGMLYAFVAARAALFIMAVIAAPVAVMGVIPQMRWLRSLWIKAVGVIALLPIVAGGVFKASLAVSGIFPGGGLLSPLIRLVWLVGAAGFMISMAGILGRLTLTTGLEVIGQIVGAAGKITAVATMAASGGGVVAASSTLAGGSSLTASLNPSSGGGLAGESAAITHLVNAQALTRQAAWQEAFGMRSLAQQSRSQAHIQELSARQAELSARMQRFANPSPGVPGNSPGEIAMIESGSGPTASQLNLSEGVLAAALHGFGDADGSELQQFREGFNRLNRLAHGEGRDLSVLAAYHPRDAGRMVRAYLEDPGPIEVADSPLRDAARRASPPADGILRDIYGEGA